MSACISREGEYGEHRLATEGTAEARFVCSRCFVFDEAAAIAEIDRLTALLAPSAPATANEDATCGHRFPDGTRCTLSTEAHEMPGMGHHTAGVTSSDGDRGLSEEWSEERRTEHFYRQYGRTFTGYGPSMDPHRCGDPDEECWTVTESRRVGPWEVVGDE